MNTSPDLTLAAVKMLISLGIVLSVVWGLYRLARRTMPSVSGKGKLIQVLENQGLGAKKSIAMVQVPGAVLVLGLSSDNVQLLTRLDDTDIAQKITVRKDVSQTAPGFKAHLQRLTGFAGSANPAAGRSESAVE